MSFLPQTWTSKEWPKSASHSSYKSVPGEIVSVTLEWNFLENSESPMVPKTRPWKTFIRHNLCEKLKNFRKCYLRNKWRLNFYRKKCLTACFWVGVFSEKMPDYYSGYFFQPHIEMYTFYKYYNFTKELLSIACGSSRTY